MHVIQWARCPLIAKNDYARRWLQSVADLGHARNTVEAYGRALEEYLSFTKGLGVVVAESRRDHVAAYVRSLLVRSKPDGKVVEIDAPLGLSNATARLFGIGYYSGRGFLSGRVIIPIHNQAGDLIAYAGRSVDGGPPKYKLPPMMFCLLQPGFRLW